MKELLYTISDLQKILKLSRSSIYLLRKKGYLDFAEVKLNKSVRFLASKIDSWDGKLIKEVK